MAPMSSSKEKRCSKCKELKPLDEFPRNARAHDGHNSTCRICYKNFWANKERRVKVKSPEEKKNQARKYLYAQSKRRAREKGLEHTIQLDDIIVPDVCPILQIPLHSYRGGFDRGSYSLDRIDNSKGYVPGNVRVISWRANAVKSSLSVSEIERLYQYIKGEL